MTDNFLSTISLLKYHKYEKLNLYIDNEMREKLLFS